MSDSRPEPELLPSGPAFSLGTVVGLILLVAVVAGLAAGLQGARLVSGGLFVLVFVFLVPIAVVRDIILPMVRGVECPACGDWGLQRVSVVPFGSRYYRCSACGLRCKRDMLSTWRAVKGPADEAHYHPKNDEARFEVEPWNEDDVQAGSKTIDALVRNQRRRQDPD